MTDKAALRLELKERRFALSLGERREKGCRITALAESVLKDRQSILAYAAKDPEVETLVLINRLISAGKTVSVPIIEKETRTLRLSLLESVADLEPSTFNVPEPLAKEKPVQPSEIDCVVIPLLGFDRNGNRIGYGAGYYDRFLADNPHLEKIGLAYACQEVDAVPTEENDIRLDAVITESEIIRF
ncbi:MAG: 5-formyltetrahydrofolate cyclo-ligase [Methanocorpusculum parvum]|nr:5-formyltetrahydrofolate cyclo-ligase [Methanocorpusculum parvum]